MKTLLTSALSALLFFSFTAVQAQMAAEAALVSVDDSDKSLSERCEVLYKTMEADLFFKVNISNGNDKGVMVLERSFDNEAFEIIDFKDMPAVQPDLSVLYCFQVKDAAPQKAWYRVKVATTNDSEVLYMVHLNTDGTPISLPNELMSHTNRW